ncbi:LysM peptidoglycan-binding domain-containing protein [bacterium]|nr:LysM peptidoglycan-binding domain-containing protein [bacterium]MBU1985220.1 LysM peptidoglycan-binding domain-containing protein [bacterium]
MRSALFNLAALALLAAFVFGGCASVSTTNRTSSGTSRAHRAALDFSKLTEREKWNLARENFTLAQREEARKSNEAAVRYYETVLELLGSLDMASIEIPTQRVLSFQRKVLKSYDHFLASLDKLPASAGAEAVLEASTIGEGSPNEDLFKGTGADRDQTPVEIRPNAPPLPGVPLGTNNQVAGQINFFMNKGRNVMLKWMERSARFFPRLRPILREEGIPDEVMFLAMIESGLNPRAYSYAHAAGVWQFIPSTGRIYGLEVNSVYDERLHVEASTRAACRYLRKLYEQFGDWYLAFAAYNCGELRVEREVKRSGTRDYWKLHRLPRQTRGYVPAYLAARTIYENPARYGFPPLPAEEPFECERVWIDGAYKLEHVADAAGHDAQAVKDLNPEYLRGVTRRDASNMVRLPRPASGDFDTRLAKMPETVVKPTTVHHVRKGETLGRIAQRYGTSVSAIRSQPENRGIKPNRLRIGQRIVVPVPDIASSSPKPSPSSAKQVVNKTASSDTNHEIIYTVHRGETLGKIAGQIGVSVDEICRQNSIRDADEIQPGQKLRIRVAGDEPVAKAERSTRVHTVQPGDTVWSIAQTYGQDYQKILSWNRLHRRSTIYPGQQLIVDKD